MSDDLSLLRDTIRKILSPADTVSSDKVLSRWPSQTWVDLEDSGMTGVGIDEMHGGSGGTVLDVATLAFEVGGHSVLTPLVETTMLAGWLTGLANWTWTGGVESLGLAARGTIDAFHKDSSLLLSGRVRNVPWARFAQRVVVVAEVRGDTLITQLAPEQFVVEPSLNMAGEPIDSLVLNRVRLGTDKWIVSPISYDGIRRHCAFARAVSSAGAMNSILDMTVPYASERQQFGRPINRFQAVQHLLAQLAEETFSALVSTRTALNATINGDGELETLSAIVRVARASTKVARISHQVHGAIGTTEEHSLHHFTKRLWCWRNEFGGEAAWSRAITDHVRQHGGFNRLWSTITD